jgi:DNA-binding CsgD family transcriptional regulator
MPAQRTRNGPQVSSVARLPTDPVERTRTWPQFSIGKYCFVAIPHKEWSARQRSGEGNGELRSAGFVRLDGVRHVLVERQDFDGVSENSASISTMLTSRELQIAYSVADGKCDKVIAYDLGISEYTVREHMRRIFHKLNVSKRAALVAQLIKTRFDYPVGASGVIRPKFQKT